MPDTNPTPGPPEIDGSRPSRGAAYWSETNRLEGFSDAVFAIVLTLMVLELLPGRSAVSTEELLGGWASYLTYLASFLTAAGNWLSHHNTFARLKGADSRVLVMNLSLLLGVSLIPWPTALIANAIRSGTKHEQVTAVFVYAFITGQIGVSWTALSAYLGRHPHLVHGIRETQWIRRNTKASAASTSVAFIGAAIAFVSPLASLVLFLIVPALFICLSLRQRQPPEQV
ncbi:TMEM175 family protein [Micromonospora sp. 067-2]|uniref:TMEM175 family protein n=1 Tax=Micromonospora sp. 067-2 TaxID=2789270 RepID=UPI00397CB309